MQSGSSSVLYIEKVLIISLEVKQTIKAEQSRGIVDEITLNMVFSERPFKKLPFHFQGYTSLYFYMYPGSRHATIEKQNGGLPFGR